MAVKIYVGLLVSIFLISGLANMANVTTTDLDAINFENNDLDEAQTELELDASDPGSESPEPGMGLSSTRAIDLDLTDIYWQEKSNDRIYSIYGKAIQCADLNKDGLMDIVDGTYKGLYVSLQNTDGTWISMNNGIPFQQPSNPYIYGLDVGDINNDGWVDIIVMNFSSSPGDAPNIYLNNNGTSWTHQSNLGFTNAIYSHSLTLEDFNNDGILDTAYVGGGSVPLDKKIVIYLQNPIGTWTQAKLIDSLDLLSWNSMDSCDYDNDGDMDLVVGGGSSGKFYIVTNNNGSGINWTEALFQAPSASGIYWGYLVSTSTADLNLDGYQDIVFGVYSSNDRNILTLYYNGSAWNEILGNLPYFGSYVDFSINDINFDGKPDIIASGDGGADVFLGDANYNWAQLNTGLSSGSDANCVVDIDNDGVLEIVDTDGIYDTIGLEKLFVKNFNKLTSNLPLGERFSLAHGDVNNDGLLDLLALRDKGVVANNVVVYTNNGDGTWNFYSAPDANVGGIVDGQLADMDNDGDLDIIFSSSNWYNNVILVRNAGDGTFPDTKETIYSVPKVSNKGGRAYSVDVGDFDLDGDLDVLAPGKTDHLPLPPQSYSLWLIKNNSGVWEKENLTTSSNQIYNAKFVKINDDPYLDIISCGYNGYGAKVFLYNNATSNWDEHSTGLPTTTINCIDYGDINNDRVLEIILDMKIYTWNSTSLGWDQIYNFAQTCIGNYFIDLNFDGLEDIIQLHQSFTGGFTVWTNKGDNVWQKGVYQNSNNDYFEQFTTFDFNWDGTTELFLGSTDVGVRIYELGIEQDKTEVVFSNPQPSSDTWLDSTTVSPSVVISDIEGSGVDGNMIEYSYKTHLSPGYTGWITCPAPQDAQEIEVTVSNLVFQEGDDNFIKWRAKDVVGNGYTESPPYQLKIDVTNPYFQNENPPNDTWVNSQSQTLSVQINDDWAGLDAPSIKYKLDTGNGYGGWVSAGETTNSNTLVPSTIAYLSEGVNKIKWSATDIVGHTVESSEYIIKLDTKPTIFKSPEPEEGEWMTQSNFKCAVNIFDSGINGSGVNSSNIQFRYSTAGLFEYGVWQNVPELYQVEDGQQIGVHVNTSVINFLEGTNNYVQYQALDLATNGYTASPDYQILIDTIDVTFINPLPTPDNWQASNEVTCYITIEDIDSSGVDGTSAEYWIVKDNSNPSSESPNWTKAVTQISAESVTFSETVELPDGIYNWIKWRAKDVAGNDFNESGWYQIKVDSTEISFSNPTPTPDQWRKTSSVNADVVVTIDTDPNNLDYSNPQSLQYRYSTNGVTNFGLWNNVNLHKEIDPTTLVIFATLPLLDGIDNYVQWRAKENVSEDYSLSDPYQIKVDTQIIVFTNPLPATNDWQASPEVTCYITIEDIGGSGVDGSSPYYWVVKDNPNPDSESSNWTKVVTQPSGESITFSAIVELPDGIYNWIKWCAKDVAGNGYTYSTWSQIKVDSTPIAFSSPTPTSEDWMTSTLVNSSIIVSIDTDPNHLDYSNPQSLQYRYSTNGVLGFGSWQTVDNYWIIDNTTLLCNATAMILADGTDNYVQWRALENVSEGIHTTSLPYPIQVDSTVISYTNPVPTSNTENEYLEITCYITIQDSGSGVDGSSIQYRYSVNGTGDSQFTSWNSTVSQPDGQSITVSITIELEHGEDNYLQWAAKDVAGNGATYSQKYQIKVNFIDTDGDGISDDNDYDDDNDGVLDNNDDFPLDPTEWTDTDNDGTGDNTDTDDDNDGVPDSSDAFPTNPAEYLDSDSDGIGDNSDSDDDNDGVPDLQDDFPYNATEWSDTDNDGIGDNTDTDIDGDGYLNANDAFPTDSDEWDDTDGDGTGDNSDTDIDSDGYINSNDAFPYDSGEWTDTDNDGTGDNTDTDDDNDGVPDSSDAFPTNPAEYLDSDSDGIGDNSDSDDDNDGVVDLQDDFPYNSTEWSDTDNDGIGDNTDPDIDGDGYLNANDAFQTDSDEWDDMDSDGIGDNSDTDIDGDGYINPNDEFPYDPSEWLDTDNDGIGDNTDTDDDNDGVLDTSDAFPTNSAEYSDSDGDGIGDNSDSDDDNDGVADLQDDFPYDPGEWTDTDNDGIGDNSDPDIDGDGYANADDDFPMNPNEWNDWDGDGTGDNSDSDDDNDGVADLQDDFPKDSGEWTDTDNDGTGDNSDDDIDGDGYDKDDDDFPMDPDEWYDTDGDGTGDNSDTDIDGDGYINPNDAFPYVSSEWQDTDKDGSGDNTDTDDDNDGVSDLNDTFPRNPAEYSDNDGDGIGDNSDPDDDNDGVADLQDDFPNNSTEWSDTDDDGIGDNSDSDIDGDGHSNANDAFPTNPNEWEDFDGDGIGDNTDTDIDGDGYINPNDEFPYNPEEWSDTDGDGAGDNVDTDDDGDGISDNDDAFPSNPAEYSDWDNDSIGDNADSDDDNDGVPDLQDDFPYDPNEWMDSDNDGTGDNSDPDDDNDGFNDDEDELPLNPNEWKDLDGDGIGDNADSDRDGDGYANTNDAFPGDPSEWQDTDGNGIGNNEDEDDDNDGVPDINDTFPTNSAEHSDLDGDGIGDNSDLDIDGDGWSNTIEETAGSDPEDYYGVPSDTDSDGVGDNADLDDDNDGVPDYEDYAPLDKKVQSDPNLIRIMGVEFEVGELVMGVMMAIAMAFFGTFVFTRKKRLYNKHKHNIENCKSVKQLNAVNSEIKLDMEKEHLTSIQLTMLKEQFDEKFMSLRQKELERKLGRLPGKVEDSVREIISDKIITQEEFTGMQSWLARLKDSKDFDTDKKEKLQGVLRDWIDENIIEDWDVKINKKK